MNDRIAILARRTGTAAIAAGVLFPVSVGAELLQPVEQDGKIVNLPLALVYLGLYGAAMACLVVALASLRSLHRAADRPLSQAGRVGLWTTLAGSVLHTLFSIQLIASAVNTRTLPEVWALFGLGFLLLVVGQPLLAAGVRRADLVPGAWVFPLLGLAGTILVFFNVDPIHDIGLFVFGAAWIGLGVRVLGRGGVARVAA
jgi:hypothetical protein